MAAGSVVGWGLVVNSAASWLSWQGYLLGPLGGRDGAWAGANLGVLVSLLIGVLGHLASAEAEWPARRRVRERPCSCSLP